MAFRGLLKFPIQRCARPVPLQPWKRFALVGGATMVGVTATAGTLVALHDFERKHPESWLSKRSPKDPIFLGWIGSVDSDEAKAKVSSPLRLFEERRRLMRNSLGEDALMGSLMIGSLGLAICTWRRPTLFNSRCEYAFSRAWFGILGCTATLSLYRIQSCSYPAFVAANNMLNVELKRLQDAKDSYRVKSAVGDVSEILAEQLKQASSTDGDDSKSKSTESKAVCSGNDDDEPYTDDVCKPLIVLSSPSPDSKSQRR